MGILVIDGGHAVEIGGASVELGSETSGISYDESQGHTQLAAFDRTRQVGRPGP